jgi:hypothetical protein
MAQTERFSYLIYRCTQCKRILTKYQIQSRWEQAERTGEPIRGICACGSSRVSPTNATVWEELTNPHIWKVWWRDVLGVGK